MVKCEFCGKDFEKEDLTEEEKSKLFMLRANLPRELADRGLGHHLNQLSIAEFCSMACLLQKLASLEH